MSRSLQVFIACALGAGIGGIITLQSNSYSWWIGIIVGGIIGYLSYEPKQVLVAVKTAWCEVVNHRPDKEGTFDTVWGTLAVSSVFISCVWIFVATTSGAMHLGWVPEFFNRSSEDSIGPYLSVCVLIVFTFSYSGFCILAAIFTLYDEDGEDSDIPLVTRRNNKRICYRVNPITLSIYWPVRIIITTTVFLWNYTPTAVRIVLRTTLRFTKTVFITIHSQERLLCGVDAAIGAAIGFFFGNPIVGALAGGVIGVLNFEIVSRRILHLSFEKS